MKSVNDMAKTDALEQELQYLRKISERNVAKILALDTQSIGIRHELELKRRGFALLAELSVSLRHRADYKSVFVSATRRINAALNMQRTVVLTPDEGGRFRASVLQGYPEDEKKLIASRGIDVCEELLVPERAALVTGADPEERLAEFREAVGVSYFVSSPIVMLDNSVTAVLLTGRMVEESPYLPRLAQPDVETIQAVSALLGAVLIEKRLADDLRKARDLAEKSSKAKGEFLANVSHEVHTPMNAIMGMARILSKTGVTEQQRQSIEDIVHSTRLLLRVFNDILEYAELDTGRMTLQAAPFSIRGEADGVYAIVKKQAAEKSLSFDMAVEADVPETVLGDQKKVGQVMLNLAENAVKFTDSGGVRARVACVRDAYVRDTCVQDTRIRGAAEKTEGPEKIQLVFEVEDTGIGMDEKEIEVLFTPFTQADSSYTRKYGGSGLGLAICARLADLMRGEIRCESRIGEGSKFTFTVPLELPEGHDALDEFYGLRVLLVEDNKINQLVAADMLSAVGIDAAVAANGIEALKALEDNEYDLILMDIQMPEMDGLTAAALIRANPKYKDLPIVALTAHALPEDREASLRSGMNDHLAKPIEPEQLYSSLRHWTRRSPAG